MVIWSFLVDLVRAGLFGLTHLFGGNVGLAILALSLTVRLGLLPWTLRAARRSRTMAAKLKQLEPQIRNIQTRYSNDLRQLQLETARAYRDAGVNPVKDSGILTTVVQLPIVLALYSVIRSAASQGRRFLWLPDIASPDLFLSLAASALTVAAGLTVPSHGAISSSQIVMALATGFITFLIVFKISAGVTLYWAASSGVGLLQNALLRRTSIAKS